MEVEVEGDERLLQPLYEQRVVDDYSYMDLGLESGCARPLLVPRLHSIFTDCSRAQKSA